MWHVHARDYLKAALERDDTQVVGVWDNNPEFCREIQDKFYVTVFQSLDELLNSDAEGVIVTTATREHPDVLCRIARAGKKIFTEKVLALSDEEANRIACAVNETGVEFVISMPHKYGGGIQTVKSVVDSGELEKINYFRFRNCHGGSVDNWLPAHFYQADPCGGGAMIDLGAHGMYLADWFCGVPDTYASTFTRACHDPAVPNVDGVEDNAVTVMGYANGCIALNETGFVSRGYPMSLEIGGENGWVRFDHTGVHKSTKATELHPVEVRMLENLPKPIDQFLSGKILPGCGMEEATRLTHMMVEAYRNCAR